MGTGRLLSGPNALSSSFNDCYMWAQDYDISSLRSATITNIDYNFTSDTGGHVNPAVGVNEIDYVTLGTVRANATPVDIFNQLTGVAQGDKWVTNDSTAMGASQSGIVDLGTLADTSLTNAIANGDTYWGFGSVLTNGGVPTAAGNYWYIAAGFNIDVTYGTVTNALTL